MLPTGQTNPLAAILQGLTYSPTIGTAHPYYNPTPQTMNPLTGIFQNQPMNPIAGLFQNQPMNPLTGIFQNPAIRPALFASGGAALGSTVAGPVGGAIGGGAGPFLSNLFSQEKEPLQQIAVQAGLAALGGGLGSNLGPIGAAAGAGTGSYLGYQLNRPQYGGSSYQPH